MSTLSLPVNTELDVVLPAIVLLGILSWLIIPGGLQTKDYQRPPGPKPLPLVGNILDIPSTQQWLRAAEWGKKYGDLIFIKPMGRPMLFVNSYEVATDILDKRSAIYSSRPHSVMVELTRLDWIVSNMQYGEYWRRHRLLIQKYLEKPSLRKYLDYQLQSTHKLLSRLLEGPDDFRSHIRHCIGTSILRIAYGHEVKADNDPYILMAEEGLRTLVEATTPGSWMVELIPWLKFLPSWFPGVKFHDFAKKGSEKSQRLRLVAYQDSKKNFLNGIGGASMTGDFIEGSINEMGVIQGEELIINSVGAFFAAGTDTSISPMLTFVLAMVLYPEVQQRAHEEIDRVVGTERLPTFDDLDNLPYVGAIFKETLRWQPVVPLGAPHVLTQDDIFDGYHIPKGTIVFPNVWYMLHDPNVYPDPDIFKPERHLVDSKPGKGAPLDPGKVVFGFGRRACPGRMMAENNLMIMISNILAAFTIEKTMGLDGKPVNPDVKYYDLISHPSPFEAKITPRSPKYAKMIQEAVVIDPVH